MTSPAFLRRFYAERRSWKQLRCTADAKEAGQCGKTQKRSHPRRKIIGGTRQPGGSARSEASGAQCRVGRKRSEPIKITCVKSVQPRGVNPALQGPHAFFALKERRINEL
jgi:hypothetical protein